VPRPDVVLCDLDGTITDSIPGIYRCLRHALPLIGMPDMSDEQLRAFLGPPLHYTLKEVHSKSDEDVAAFVTEYRAEYFGAGEYEFDVFPGMAALIADIGASDMRLALATAKPIESAVRVLTRAGLIDHFDFVSGSELDLLRQDKPSVIAHAIAGLGADPSSVTAVMIGDRKEDVLGAHHHGFASIGVLWGYSDEGELEAAGAGHVVTRTDEIRPLLGL
jgi:phosphoglycolate phosphatase